MESNKLNNNVVQLLFGADEKNLEDYGVKEGTKLILAVRNNADAGPDANHLRSAAYTFLRRFYSDPEARKIQEEFIKVSSYPFTYGFQILFFFLALINNFCHLSLFLQSFHKSVNSLSLDDLERIATLHINEVK